MVGFKRESRAACLLMMLVFAGCAVQNSPAPPRREGYVWIPPSTGTNVGRWVAKEGAVTDRTAADEEKKRRVEKRAQAKKAKANERASEAEPRSTSPPDRFR